MDRHSNKHFNQVQVPLNFIPGITKPTKSQDNLVTEANMSRARSFTDFLAPLAGYLKRVRSMDCLPAVRRRLVTRNSDVMVECKDWGCTPHTDQIRRRMETSHRRARSFGQFTKTMTSCHKASRHNNEADDGNMYSRRSGSSYLECEKEMFMHKKSISALATSMPDLDYVDLDRDLHADKDFTKSETSNHLQFAKKDCLSYSNNVKALKRTSRYSHYLLVNDNEKRISSRLSRSSRYLSDINNDLKRLSYRKTRSSEYLSQINDEMPAGNQIDYLQEVQNELRSKLPKTFITAANIGLTHSYCVMKDMSNATVPHSLPRSNSRRSLLAKALFKEVRQGGKNLSKSFSFRGSSKSIDNQSEGDIRSSSISLSLQEKDSSLFKRARLYARLKHEGTKNL